MIKRFFVDYLGCKVNSYEINAIKEVLLSRGHIFDEINPEIIIINTCSVTSISDKKSRNLIRFYRRKFPESIVIAMGCSTQSSNPEVYKDAGANIIIGCNKKSEILSIFDEKQDKSSFLVDIQYKTSSFLYDEITRISTYDQVRAYVKIQDGCNNFCSYCLIPYIRGRARSRCKENILKEINNLVNNGFKEIVLTGIDVASYGLDLYENFNLSCLLEYILINTPNLLSLRISSIEESLIDDKFIGLLKKYEIIADHMHLSLQSGSDSVLKRMNRKYKTDEFIKKVEKIREARPNISLTTDIIVGFPGETDEEFEETYAFAKKCEFSKIHVFPYSSRKGTAASNMKNQVNPTVKKERAAKLRKLSTFLEKEYISKFLGKEIDFLIEQFDSKTGCYKGHSSNYLECNIKSDALKVNELVKHIVNFDSVKIS